MKNHTRSFLTALGGALFATTGADAAYHGLTVHNAGNHLVNGINRTSYRVYAVFSDPGDFLTSVAGSPTLGNMVIQSCNASGTGPGGNFVNPVGGSATAPTFYAVGTQLEWDTFVTIGLASVPYGSIDETGLSPGFNGIGNTASFSSNNVGWFTAGPKPQGMAGNGLNLGGGLWGVLMMQLTVNAGNYVRGTVAVGGVHNTGQTGGTPFQTNADQTFWCIPTPGALALFALAGLGGVKSRRRMC
jgi:hypothetical protein